MLGTAVIDVQREQEAEHTVPGIHNLREPKVGIKHRLHHQKGPAEDVLPALAQEVQSASGAADPVLHCNHPV